MLLRCERPEPPMSQLGQQQRIGSTGNSSAHPPNSRHASGHALASPSGPNPDMSPIRKSVISSTGVPSRSAFSQSR
jgi:hypothetical protein